MSTFEQLGLSFEVLAAIEDLGYKTPTPIQEATIPRLMESGQDMIGLAQTGTGKTAAFGLPAVSLTRTEDNFPQTLVLAPTRELCMQISNDLESFSTHIKGLKVLPVYGGASIQPQIKRLQRGTHIVVGTPGRTLDLLKRRKLDLRKVERVILDEADEMLSMGFQEDLEAILDETPEQKQMLLFSATMSNEIRGIAMRYMHNPEEIAVARENLAAKNIQHICYQVRAADRYELLKRIADLNPKIYAIVFCRTRREVKEVAQKLLGDGYNADTLHGDLSQPLRDEAMDKFRNHLTQILVATDVAARGLDVDDLTHVINFNLPDDPEVYVHRSGRTARAGKSGISIAIIHSREKRKLNAIEKIGGITFSMETAPSGKEICTKQLYALIDKMEHVEVDETEIAEFMPEIYKKLSWLSREDLIKRFVSVEFNRFLDYYKDAKDINVKASSRKNDDYVSDKRERKNWKDGNIFAWMRLNVGGKHRISPKRLIGTINEAFDSSDVEIGRIEIFDEETFFQIERNAALMLSDALMGLQIYGIPVTADFWEGEPPAKVGKKFRARGGGGRGDRRKSNSGYGGESRGKKKKFGQDFKKKSGKGKKRK